MSRSNRKTQENEMVSYDRRDVVNPTQNFQASLLMKFYSGPLLSKLDASCLFYIVLPRGVDPAKCGEQLGTVQRRATILKRSVLASDSRPWLSPGSYCTGEEPA